MSEPARNRFALDLEDLERQLRGAGQTPRPGQQADPLAELTRIVGQDDPLKDIFAERRQPPRPAMRQEPSFEVVPQQPAPAVPEVSQPPAEMRGALDEFEALLRRTEPVKAAPQPDIASLETELSETLGTRVTIAHGRGGKGKLIIQYTDLDTLDGVLERLRPKG